MFKKLIEFITEAFKKLFNSEANKNKLSSQGIYTISEAMQNAIEMWLKMYKDESPWLDNEKGIYSLGIPKMICQSVASQILSEMKININSSEQKNVMEDPDVNTMPGFLQNTLEEHFLPFLSDYVEKSLATGGVIFKPYMANDTIYIDCSYQGRFYPLEFDDDGKITDIAFLDQFTSENIKYSKIERQKFNVNNHTITVTNKVYKTETRPNTDKQADDIGEEIDIKSVPRWQNIEPETVIENVEKPLFGYYKIPLSNNIDLDCPLGISIFSPATDMIKRADMQYSRLDWEYEGGQLAINVDPTAIHPTSGYYGTNEFSQDQCKDRLYKALDLGADDTYHEFAPSLRDTNYMNGLDKYLCKVEDLCGVARGTVSSVEAEARTATEIKILKQRTYTTINSNQNALQSAIDDLVYAINVYVTLYNLCPIEEYVVNIEWNDSILTDINEELQQKLLLTQEGVLSKAELRSWYLEEDIDTAKLAIMEMQQESMMSMMGDTFFPENTPKQEEQTTQEQGSSDLDSYGEEVATMLEDLLKELS